MTLSELLSRRLILVSGKGGVGKTTVSLALGLLANKLKKNVLLIEFNSTDRLAPYFRLKKVGQKLTQVKPGLSIININPSDCFEEFILSRVHFKPLVDMFVKSRFVTAFLDAVPGLNELLMVGRIYEAEKELKKKSKTEKNFDLIVVDCPASGHGVSSFEVPHVLSRAITVGPLRVLADQMIELLTDAKRTVFCPVTLAEEMPVTETIELIDLVKDKLKIKLGPIFLNNIYDAPFSKDESEKIQKIKADENSPLYPYVAYSNLAIDRTQLNKTYSKLLKSQAQGYDIITIEHLHDALLEEGDLKPLVQKWLKEVA